MAKLTKKSHKRRRLLMGLSVFMSIALVSTGFAAWVISSSVQEEGSGNVSVGNVSDKSLALVINNADNLGNFVFEPNQADTSGRVRNDGLNFESLSVTVTGAITQNPEYLGELTIELVEMDYLGAQALPKDNSNLKKAADAGYITLPECFYNKVKLVENSTPTEFYNASDNTFSYTITFGFGELFKGINPGYFYDYKDNEGNDQTDQTIIDAASGVSDEDMIKNLVNFRNTVYGIEETLEQNKESSAVGPKYKVIVRATTN